MEPDYDKSARLASYAFHRYGADPLSILRQLPHVLLVSHDLPCSRALDSLSIVKPSGDHLNYIIIYNSSLSVSRLRRVLACELGHVLLHHDGSTPEEVYMEEADCFAHHFVAFHPARPVCFRPVRPSLSLSFKNMRHFETVDALKRTIAEEHTRFSRYIGNPLAYYAPDDVELVAADDVFSGWKNCFNVMIDGRLVGCCGE